MALSHGEEDSLARTPRFPAKKVSVRPPQETSEESRPTIKDEGKNDNGGSSGRARQGLREDDSVASTRFSSSSVAFKSNRLRRGSTQSTLMTGGGRTVKSSRLCAGMCLTSFLLLGLTLPVWLGRPSENPGAGELKITKGVLNRTQLLAPTFVNAGANIPSEGTVEAPLMWIERLCDSTLDCSVCPPSFNSSFAKNTLAGVILIHNYESDERLFMCGLNRLSRIFGQAGLVALATGSRQMQNPVHLLHLPGSTRKMYRLGEHRDYRPHDGDAGIEFPSVDLNQAALAPVLAALDDGKHIKGVLSPTQSNPFIPVLYGPHVALRVVLIIGHLFIVDRASCFLLGHFRAHGLRLDLAQLSLTFETSAHLIYAAWHCDPYGGFYWGGLPHGAFSSLLIGATILTRASTLVLAAFWRQMVRNEGLATFVIKDKVGAAIACSACALGLIVLWLMLVEVGSNADKRRDWALCLCLYPSMCSLGFLTFFLLLPQLLAEQDWWLTFRIPYLNSFSYSYCAFLAAMSVLIAASLFLISSMGAKREMAKWTNRAFGLRTMRQIRFNGGLMIIITVLFAISPFVIHHPIGYPLWCLAIFPILLWNSLLQVGMFRPHGKVPIGPLRAIFHALMGRVVNDNLSLKQGKETQKNNQHPVFSSLKKSRNQESSVARHENPPQRPRQKSNPPQRPRQKSRPGGLVRQSSRVLEDFTASAAKVIKKSGDLLAMVTTSSPGQIHALDLIDNDEESELSESMIPTNPQDNLPPCDRLGLSLECLEAFASHYGVTPEMTTKQVCELYIKSYTKNRKCVYQDLIWDHPDLPPTWLGKTTHFVSHW